MFRTSIAATVLAAALTLAAAACGGDDSTGPTAPRNGTVSLHNASNTNIVQVNFSDCDDTSWGANRLNASEVIAPGATRTWTVGAGCYDFRASTASKSGYWYDRVVDAGETLPLQLSPAANESGAAVAALTDDAGSALKAR